MRIPPLAAAMAALPMARTPIQAPAVTGRPQPLELNVPEASVAMRSRSSHDNRLANVLPFRDKSGASTQLVLDGDWGGDELMTLSLLLAHAEDPIAMVSAVSGNVACDKISENMVAVLDFLGASHIPAFPCFEQNEAYDGAHGENGMGGVRLPPPSTRPQDASAHVGLEALLAEAEPDSVTLFATGPLSNISRLLSKHPEHAEKIRAVIVMGGSLSDMPAPNGPRRGNITPHSEFNFFSDPSAAAHVLACLHEKVTLLPMNCTHQLTFTPARQKLLADSNIPAPTKALLAQLLKAPADMDMKKFNLHPTMHDLHVALYYLFPSLYAVERGGVCVETGGETRGRTDHCETGATVNYATHRHDPDHAYQRLLDSLEHNFSDERQQSVP